MSILDEIRPKKKERVIDLVKQGGIDVSDWSNFKGGEKGAAANRLKNSSRAFVKGDKIILNLWHHQMGQDADGKTVCAKINYKKVADLEPGDRRRNYHIKRANEVVEAIQSVRCKKLPVRVIVLLAPVGGVRYLENGEAESSKVAKRMLDPNGWTITQYDDVSGECVLTRATIPWSD
jgi:hypothetical protein